ncbi:hypothetical protein PL373_18905 [Tenacibaculum maritimum]|nr:hypothetical protein [Tenacibaculum maritimum]MDB0603158.1 hypothetical protein [Tenacibaculum maritimum]MDB0610421.1 hypothetical protein [Tenacibaculum maritimum]
MEDDKITSIRVHNGFLQFHLEVDGEIYQYSLNARKLKQLLVSLN